MAALLPTALLLAAVPALLARGAAKAREVAAATYDRSAAAVGLLGPA